MLHLYIGYDRKEKDAFNALLHSLEPWREDVFVHAIHEPTLRNQGLFWRTSQRTEQGTMIDNIDGRPFTTEFAFTRFLTPWIHKEWRISRTPWAVFCDSDFMFRANPKELESLLDPRYAILCVKHQHQPTETTKMSGQPQTAYPRKNWSSLTIWNVDHQANKRLTVKDVNQQTGRWLHGFEWLSDELIGELPQEWNWLEGSSDPNLNPKAVHFTRGVPTHVGMENIPYAEEWRQHLDGHRRQLDGGRPS